MPHGQGGTGGHGGGPPGKRNQVSKSRTGIRTTLVKQIDTEIIENRVISKSLIPFIRSKTITFKGYGFLPNTQVYPFFDRKKVSAYVTPLAGFSTSGASLVTGDALITNSNGEIKGKS